MNLTQKTSDVQTSVRWVLRIALVSIGLSGMSCAADGLNTGVEQVSRASEPALAPGVDPDKALLTLDEIEPGVERPVNAGVPAPLSERAAAQVARARSLVSERRFTEATIALDRALRFDPDHPTIHAALASLHWESGSVERARTHAAQAVEGNPDLAEAQYILGRVSAEQGDHAAAIQAYRLGRISGGATEGSALLAEIDLHLAKSLAEAGYLRAAIDSYERFLAFDLSSGDATGGSRGLTRADQLRARSAMTELLVRLGRPSDAADALAPSLTETPVDPELAHRHAELLIEAGRYAEAEAAIEALPPSGERTLQLLETLYRASGHPERIVTALRSRLKENPGESGTAIRLARALAETGNQPEAQAVLRAFLERVPDNDEVRLSYINDYLMSEGQWSQVVDAAADGLAAGGAPETYEGVAAELGANREAVEALLDRGSDEPGQSSTRLYLLARVAEAADRPALFVPLLERAVEGQPDFVPARTALAAHYLDSLQYERAIETATQGKDRVPDVAELALVAGRAYERLDDVQQAELHLRAVTQLDRNHTEAMFELAQVYRRSGRTNLAQRQLSVLLEQDPGFDKARELLAVMFMGDGKVDEAFVQVREMQRLTEDPLVRVRCQAILDADLRRDAEARRALLVSAMEEHGGDYMTWIAVAETFEEFEADGRRDAYQRALEFEPDNEDALLGLIDAEQRMLDYAASLEPLEQLVQIRPNRDAYRLALLDVYSILGRDEKVIEVASAMERKGGLEAQRLRDYRSRKMQALKRLDRQDELMAALDSWAHSDTGTALWSLWLADEYLQRKEFDRAIAIYRKQVADKPQDWGAVASLADALVKADRSTEASQFVLGLLNDDPDSDQGAWMLAGVLSDAGHGQAAMQFIRDQLRRTRNREAFQDLLIDRNRAAERYDEAVALIDALLDELVSIMHAGGRQAGRRMGSDGAVELRPNEPFTPESVLRRMSALRWQKGTVLLSARQYREGEKLILEWLEVSQDPNERGRLLWLLSAFQRGQGDEDRANETLRRALVLQPENVSFNNDVAYALIDRGVELEDAERMIRLALWSAPQQPAYLDTYGWLLYKKGQFAEAEEWILRALRNQREADAVILDHLGDIAWRLGRRDQAVAYWQRAVDRISEIDFDQPRSADERRVRDETKRKIEAVESGGVPPVAPLAVPPEPQDDASHRSERTDPTKL